MKILATDGGPMTRSHPVLHAASSALHRFIARSPGLSKVYLEALGALLRATAPFPLKDDITRSLINFPWPAIEFSARRVEVCPGVTIKLVPHVGEFDFRALFTRDLHYETELLRVLASRLGLYDAIVEVGANVGVFSFFFAAKRRDNNVPVYCFEPSGEAFARLLKNRKANPSENFFPAQAAVSGTAGPVSFFEPSGHLTNGSLLEEFASKFSDNVRRSLVPSVDGNYINGLLQAYRSPLIKIDAEGSEVDVLGTLMPMISSKRPEIVLEVLQAYAQSLNDVRAIRDAYRLYLVTSEGLVEKAEFQGHPRYRDYLLVSRTAPQPESVAD